MKLTRRTFLKFAAALAPAPLVAKDMADFDFLPPQAEPVAQVVEVPKPKLVNNAETWTGALRWNYDISAMQVYDGNQWRTLAS